MGLTKFMDELKQDLKEMKSMVVELVKQGAIHNHLLKEHEARSLALQQEQKLIKAEIEPIKDHVKLVNIASKIMLFILTTILIPTVIKYLLK